MEPRLAQHLFFMEDQVTKAQVQMVINDHPNAINFVPSSHLGALPELFEAHVEVFTLTRGECVKNYEKDGSSWMPNAPALDRLARAAGISFYDLGNATRKEGPRCWIGKSQAYRMGPDGKDEAGAVCEKEFDADLQVEAMQLRGKTEWRSENGKNVKSSRPYKDDEINQALAQFIITGRERANTGAKSRAILSLLGQPRALKGIFTEKGEDSDVAVFLVSRVVWNQKNKMIAERMLDSLSGNVAALTGPRRGASLLTASTSTGAGQDEEALRPAEGQHTVLSAEAAAAAAFGAADDILPPNPPADPVVQGLRNTLLDYLEGSALPKQGRDLIQAALDRDERDPAVLQDLVTRAKGAIKAYEDAIAARAGGAQ